MKVIEIEKIKPGNPFNEDFYNMGIQIGTNVTVMMDNHSDKVCKYLIVVDTTTGERIKILFEE